MGELSSRLGGEVLTQATCEATSQVSARRGCNAMQSALTAGHSVVARLLEECPAPEDAIERQVPGSPSSPGSSCGCTSVGVPESPSSRTRGTDSSSTTPDE